MARFGDIADPLHVVNDPSGNSIGTVDTELPAAIQIADGLALPVSPVQAAITLVQQGATVSLLRAANIFKPFASTAITAGTGATIWTPAAGKKFRLMGWLISSSVAGQLIFGDNLVGTVIARSEAVAAAGVSNPGSILGNGLLSAAINNVLKLDGPTGNVAGMVWGTEE